MPHLTLEQRYQIASDIRRGLSIHMIAVGLNTYRRKIEREIARCGGRAHYTAEAATTHRQGCAAISAANHPVKSEATWTWVESELMKRYLPSPAQVAQTGRQLAANTSVSSAQATVAPPLACAPAAEPLLPDGVQTVSGSAIYHYLRRHDKQKLQQRLRRYRAVPRKGKMHWVDKAKPIAERPVEVLTRDCIGHMESDTIVGKRNESVKVLVLIDRASRFIRLGLVKNGTAAEVVSHFRAWMNDSRLPILTLTTDQGHEFSHLPNLFPDNLYACDAGKPYQKGAVEQVNSWIRQYLPKGASLRGVTQALLNNIANWINQRLRRRLGWKSAETVLFEQSAATTL